MGVRIMIEAFAYPADGFLQRYSYLKINKYKKIQKINKLEADPENLSGCRRIIRNIPICSKAL